MENMMIVIEELVESNIKQGSQEAMLSGVEAIEEYIYNELVINKRNIFEVEQEINTIENIELRLSCYNYLVHLLSRELAGCTLKESGMKAVIL